jgi:hypothetical protein
MPIATYSRFQAEIFPRDAETVRAVAANFDHHPFLFRHCLQHLELFQIPALLALAEKAMRKHNRSHYEAGDVSVDSYFGAPPQGVSIVEALAEIESGKSWVILKRIHEEPEYRAVLDQFIAELSELTSIDIHNDYYDPIATVFITSPNRIVPYHMDGEANFLSQVRGTKHVYLYDGNDRTILSEQDLERYWTGHFDAAKFREDLPEGSWSYQISPGTGVFNPAAFPHWVKNGNEVSISVSLNVKRRKNPVLSAYRANYYMRALSLRPTPPGRFKPLDAFKDITFGKAYNVARNVRRFVRDKFGI